MLNVDTFKNICMMTKTEKAKQIRKYYVKLENIFNKLINEEHLKNNFVIPILYKDGIGKFDSNNNLIKEFICKYDCCIKENISNKTLTKALTNNIMYNQYYYRQIGSKLQCISS